MISKIASGLEELNRLVKGGAYDPVRDRDLFGDWTDDLVREVTAKYTSPQRILGAIAETVRVAQMEPEAKFNKVLAAGHAQAIAEIAKVIRWAEDTSKKRIGMPQAAATRILAQAHVPDVSHVKTRSDMPEPVNAPAPTEEELKYFEVPPVFTSLAQYEQEREDRTPKKDSLPKRYPPLTMKDLGRFGDVKKVLTAVKFFLGARDISDTSRQYTKKVKEPPIKEFLSELATQTDGEGKKLDSGKKLREVVLKVLGHLRDEKLKGWQEVNNKLTQLTPEEQKLAKFWGPTRQEDSIDAKTLGRTKQQLEHAINEIFTKQQREPGDIYGDHKIVAKNAGALYEAVEELKSYLDEMGKTIAKGDDQVPENTALRNELSRLSDFLAKGGYKADSDVYKEMLKAVVNAFKSLGLTEEQKEALYWLFPHAEEGDVAMKSADEWVKQVKSRHAKAVNDIEKLEQKIAESGAKTTKLQAVVQEYQNEQARATAAFQKASAMSEVVARDARQAMTLSPAKREEALAQVVATHSSKYGQEGVKRIITFVKEGAEAQTKATAARGKLDQTSVGKMIGRLADSKRDESAMKTALDGALSMVVETAKQGDTQPSYEFKEEGLKQARDEAAKLITWVYDTSDKNQKELRFDEIPKLVAKVDNVRKKLIKLSRTNTADVMWDHGAGWMYRDEGQAPASRGVAEGGLVGGLSDDPTAWIGEVKKDDALAFLMKKSEELSKEGEGRPEQVEGPNFSQIPEILGHIQDRIIRPLKRYDPRVMRDKMIETALARADIGSQLRKQERRKQKGEAHKSEGVTRLKALKTVPEVATAPKQASLPELVRGFMARMAALRVTTNSFMTRAAAVAKKPKKVLPFLHTKREKKSGPVYLDVFFIDPDGVDEFTQALHRGGFDFVNSLALQSGLQSPEEEKAVQEMSAPSTPGAEQPQRGFKLDIDDVVAKTMMKGSASLRDHILANKDRMAAILGKRKDDIQKRIDSATALVDHYRAESGSSELQGQLNFLKALASFLRDPELDIEGRVPEAFGEKAGKERRQTLKQLQSDLGKTLEKVNRRDEFASRRKQLAKKYKAQGIDPETQADYRYADEVVKDVSYLLSQISVSKLQRMYEDIPAYDKLQRKMVRLQDRVKSSGDVDEDEWRQLLYLEDRVQQLNTYLSKKPAFVKMQKIYPADSVNQRDEETEKIYTEHVKSVPEDKRRGIREEHETRLQELSELETWDDYRSWIRKIQKPKYPETRSEVAAEAAQARAVLTSLKKQLSEAQSAGSTKKVEDLQNQIVKAEKDVQALENKLAKMHSRKTDLRDVQPGVHEPHEQRRSWKMLMQGVEDAILGEQKPNNPKILSDLANESVLIHADTDEFTAKVRAIEKALRDAGAETFPVLKEMFGLQGGWEKTKADVEARLKEIAQQVAEKKALLDAARKKLSELPSGTEKTAAEDIDDTQTPQQVAEAEILALEGDIANLEQNAASLRELLEAIGKYYDKQMQLSKGALVPSAKKVQTVLARPLPMVSLNDTKVANRVKKLLDLALSMNIGTHLNKSDDMKLDGLMKNVADLELDIEASNEKVRRETKMLSEVKREVDSLYRDSTSKETLLRKIQQKYQSLSSLRLKEYPAKEFIEQLIQAKKVRGELTNPQEEKDLQVLLEKKAIPSERYRTKKASDDGDHIDKSNIENWLRSAPRQYLEELPRIGVNDWDLIESLYGERLAEYRNLIHGNQIVVDGPEAKDRVRKIMEEADRKAAEIARLKALKDMTVSIGGRDIKVSQAGNIFNRELSSYLVRKNRALIGLERAQQEHNRLTHELESYKEFVGDKSKPTDDDVRYQQTHEMKQDLTDREVQSIVDQFYRGLYWYLQDYWATKSGKEAVFGTRESPEFSKLYDAMSTLSGVRSNPTIQKVLRVGSEARRHLRDVNMAITKVTRELKSLGIDPSTVVDHIAQKYGAPNTGDPKDKNRPMKITSMKDLVQEEERMKRTAPFEGKFKSGVQLYFLMRYRDQLMDQIESKNAMYDLLRETVPVEYKVQILESIKDKTQDKSLQSEIEKRIETMREDAKALAQSKAEEAQKDIAKAVNEGLKTLGEIEVLKGLVEQNQAEQTGSPVAENKVASYTSHPAFDVGIFYGAVMQSKIASMAATILKKNGARR